MLQDCPNGVYTSQFIENLLEDNWEAQQRIIIRRYFSVYLFYLITSIVYMRKSLTRVDEADTELATTIPMQVFCGVVFLLWLSQVYLEVLQLKDAGLSYFRSFWNQVDVTGLLSTLIILFMTSTGLDWIPPQALRVIGAFASCLSFMKLFDWLRLFEQTAFYVLLIGETIYDIRYFVLLLLTTLVMFGVPLVILDGSSPEGSELMEGTLGFWPLDLIYT